MELNLGWGYEVDGFISFDRTMCTATRYKVWLEFYKGVSICNLHLIL